MTNSSITLVARPGPLMGDTVYTQLPAGQTIAQMLGDAAHSCSVSVGGYEVPRELWSRVRPKAGQSLSIILYPQGNGSGAKWLRIIAMVVLTIVTYGVASGAFLSGVSVAGLSGASLAAAISLVGALQVPALTPNAA